MRKLDAAVVWALDLETSGLHAARDRILAVGMVPIRSGVVRYGERFATLVRPPDGESLSTDSLREHHLIPADLRDAPRIDEVLPQVDKRLREGVLLVHHAPIEVGFLKAGYERTGLGWPKPAIVDTLDLLRRLHRRGHKSTPQPSPATTALADVRHEMGLPAYPAHDALSDALAAAELFLVLRSKLRLC